jgi:hypothetical protein
MNPTAAQLHKNTISPLFTICYKFHVLLKTTLTAESRLYTLSLIIGKLGNGIFGLVEQVERVEQDVENRRPKIEGKMIGDSKRCLEST